MRWYVIAAIAVGLLLVWWLMNRSTLPTRSPLTTPGGGTGSSILDSANAGAEKVRRLLGTIFGRSTTTTTTTEET